MKTFSVNGQTVCLIGLDAPKPPRLPDNLLWQLYKTNILGIWPGEDEQPSAKSREVKPA